MLSVDFRTIRPLHHSQNSGFEELCCQIAAREEVPQGSRFVRNGTPDGGVEGYWRFPDGSEHGWQAKLFFDIGPSQWQQLDKSVATALEKHPRLTRYTVCLPIDLPDARLAGQQSLRQKWQERVAKWERAAQTRGMTVSFDLWGQSELLTRLAREQHAGRVWFWFRQVDLSSGWFENHLKEVIAAADPRYTPELNVELPIAARFEALGYTATFREGIASARRKCREAYRALDPRGDRATDPENLNRARVALARTWYELEAALVGFGDTIPTGNHHGTVRTAIRDARSSAHSMPPARRPVRGRFCSSTRLTKRWM